MGMFDCVHVPVKCPYCGWVTRDGQTKDFDRLLNHFKIGDDVSQWINEGYIDCIYDCRSPSCRAKAEARDIKRQGCRSGFGMLFDVFIEVKRGKVTRNYQITKLWDGDTNDQEIDTTKIC